MTLPLVVRLVPAALWLRGIGDASIGWFLLVTLSGVTPPPAPAPVWRVSDFLLAYAGGLAGGLVAVVTSLDNPSAQIPALLVGQYAGQLASTWWVVARRGRRLSDLGLEILSSDSVYLVMGIVAQIVLALLLLPIASLIGLQEGTQTFDELLPAVEGTTSRAVVLISLALLGPLSEELLFRGILLRYIQERRSARAAVVWSAAVFALFHVLGLTPDDPLRAAVIVLPQTYLLGLYLASLVLRRGRLGPAIFTHAGFNLVAALALMAT